MICVTFDKWLGPGHESPKYSLNHCSLHPKQFDRWISRDFKFLTKTFLACEGPTRLGPGRPTNFILHNRKRNVIANQGPLCLWEYQFVLKGVGYLIIKSVPSSTLLYKMLLFNLIWSHDNRLAQCIFKYFLFKKINVSSQC